MHDDRSIERIMQEELHNECFMDRCFESAKQVKNQVTAVPVYPAAVNPVYSASG